MYTTTDNMEMPCLCDCGEWFDLHDGYGSKHNNKVICPACARKEKKQHDFKEELLDAYSDDSFRMLSWNQPYASLMLHGKIETRNRPTNVRGKVLICSCQRFYRPIQVLDISGINQTTRIDAAIDCIGKSYQVLPNGYAIAVADLVDCRPMTKEDEDKCFVSFRPGLWCWIFKDVRAIEPFPVKGKQGWRFVKRDVIDDIVTL